MFTCYDEQYSFAKDSILTAIRSGNNVVLYGSGCNGKTHLLNNVEKEMYQHGYCVVREPGCDANASYWNDFLENNHVDKWVVCTTNKEQLFTTFRETTYTLINMDIFRYPQYSVLRSGRNRM